MIQMLHNLINPPLAPFITKAMKMQQVDKSICSKRKSLTYTQIHHALDAVMPFFTSEHWYSWAQLHLAINCIYTHYAANDTAKKTTDTATAPFF
jgi:hypothetical protein